MGYGEEFTSLLSDEIVGEEALAWSVYAVCERPIASSVLAKMRYYDKGFLCHSDSKGTEVIVPLSKKEEEAARELGHPFDGYTGVHMPNA